MKVLISGGAGFIGSATAASLLARGHSVTVLDALIPQVHGPAADWPLSLMRTCRLIRGDVRNGDDWLRAIEGVQAVYHLAAETGTGQSMYSAARYCDVNVTGTAVLSDILAAGGHKIERVVLASSRAVYGEGAYTAPDGTTVYPGPRSADRMQRGEFTPHLSGRPIRPAATPEDAALQPTSVYGLTKLAQEQLLGMACQARAIPLSILRYQNVYGPGQSLRNPYTGVLSIFAALARSGRTIDVFEDGLSGRDFVFIDDVAEANVLALRAPTPEVCILNIGTGLATSTLDVVHRLEACLGRRVSYVISGRFRNGDIRTCYADVTRARDFLGFTAKTSVDSGIARLVQWVLSQAPAEIDYSAALREAAEREPVLV